MNAQATPSAGRQPAAKAPAPEKSPMVAARTSAAAQEPAATASCTSQPDSGPGATAAFIEPGQRQAMIAEAAYYRAERRGFEAGHELEDWRLAESEIDGMLRRG